MSTETKDTSGWSHWPDPRDAERNWRLTRTPTKGTLTVTSFSDQLIGRYTHFSGRTRPCPGEGCEDCAANNRPRWTGWLAGWSHQTRERIILEVTKEVALKLKEFRDRHATLRGANIRLSRRNNRPNGQIICIIDEALAPADAMPTSPDLRPILMRLWEVRHLDPIPELKIVKPRLAPTGTDDIAHD